MPTWEQRVRQNSEVNLVSQSDTIDRGSPQFWTYPEIKAFANFSVVSSYQEKIILPDAGAASTTFIGRAAIGTKN
jgi:hypothetical protein